MTVRTLAVLFALLAPAAAAQAATTVDSSDGTVFVEGDEEANAITLTTQDEYVVIAEAGKTVTDADENDDCEQNGDVVRCTTLGGLSLVRVRGGEGGDTLTADTDVVSVALHGLGGDDTLNSSPDGVGTEMLGGDGNDTLNARAGDIGPGDAGGPGDDVFNGNPGAIDSFGQEPGADAYFGGTRTFTAAECLGLCPDHDHLEYVSGPVTVTLDGLANDGAAGEGDNVHADVDTITGSGANDIMDVAGAGGWHWLAGGAGDDALTGGPEGDNLDGGPGTDTVRGLAGADQLSSGEGEAGAPAADRLEGGEGDDLLITGLGAEDLFGGPGVDHAIFSRVDGQTPVAFEITLDDQANDGARGTAEGDNVHADVESVAAGAGNDRLVGSGGPDWLYGGPGDDEIDGRGGVDVLVGSDGADTLLARDGGFDLVNCGEGTDPAVQADEGDRLDSCEASALAPLPAPPDTVRPQLTLSGATKLSAKTFGKARGVTVGVSTNEPAALLGQATVKGMIARAGDYVLGERSLPLAAGSRKLKLRFSRRDVRAIQRKLRKRAYRLTVRVTATDAAGNRASATRRVTIRKR